MNQMMSKSLVQNLRDYRPLIRKYVSEFKDRRVLANQLSRMGCASAPYIPAMVSLGPDNGRYIVTSDTTADSDKLYFSLSRLTGRYSPLKVKKGETLPVSDSEKVYEAVRGDGYIYKVNVPGWIYKCRVGGTSWANSGRSGILVASRPRYLKVSESSATRMLYMVGTGSDSTNGSDSANNMYPIHPGLHTYAYFPRSTSSTSEKELFFVPSVMSVCYNVRPEDYIVPVGLAGTTGTSTKVDTPMTGDIMPGSDSCKDIFGTNSSEWTQNFKTMFGYNVTDEGVCRGDLESNELDLLIKGKVDWLRELGVSLSKYYIRNNGSDDETYAEYATAHGL